MKAKEYLDNILNEEAAIGMYIGEFLGYKMYVSHGVSYSCPSLKLYGERTEQTLKNSIKRKIKNIKK